MKEQKKPCESIFSIRWRAAEHTQASPYWLLLWQSDQNNNNKSKNMPDWLSLHPGITTGHVLIRVAENCFAAPEANMLTRAIHAFCFFVCFLLRENCKALICLSWRERLRQSRGTRRRVEWKQCLGWMGPFKALAYTDCSTTTEKKHQLRNKIFEPWYCHKIPFQRSMLKGKDK